MQHLLDIEQLSRADIEALIDKATLFLSTKQYPTHQNSICTTLFYEDSTRTRLSFELAAKNLHMTTLDLNISTSSSTKGETLSDTLQTLQAMGVSHFILRHPQEGIGQEVTNVLKPTSHLINAGEGARAHPSQTLLDLMTMHRHKPRLDELKVALLGDIKHSRVANSLQFGLKKLGVKTLVQIAPQALQPTRVILGETRDDIEQGLQDADVIICLRVQKERFNDTEDLNLNDYRQHFSLTAERLKRAKPDAIIMHPGPVNRDIEIAAEVINCHQSVILEQVTNGVFMRMAILDALN